MHTTQLNTLTDSEFDLLKFDANEQSTSQFSADQVWAMQYSVASSTQWIIS